MTEAELEAPVTPVEGALHVVLIVAQAQLLLLTLAFVPCAPWMGLLAMVSAVLYIPYVTVPVEAVLAGVPALVALLVLSRVRHTGRLRIWRRMQFALLGLILATMAVSTTVVLSGHGLSDCSL